MIVRSLFREEHEIWRATVRRFVEEEIVPFHAQWEHDGIVPRELWRKAGEMGMLCCTVPEEYGGLGLDYLFDVVVFEELWRVGASGPGFLIHTDLVATYILSFGTEEQKRQWLPKMVRGEAIGSLGMTEPHAGSDLKAVRTQAIRNGDDFVVNGQKVFISNGQLCDLVVLATKTDSSAGASGITLFLLESNRPGFTRGRNLEKLGMKAQDTSELFFEDVRVPSRNMLGAEGQGFALMMTKLPQERLAQAIRSATVTETVIEWTVDYTAERKAFGQTIADFQNTQFVLADLKARATMARGFTDKCIDLFQQGKLDPVDAAMAKLVTSELHCEAVDKCLQLFGGWGYMWEYPISRAYADARVVKIAGGSVEGMKMIIDREMLKGRFTPRAKRDGRGILREKDTCLTRDLNTSLRFGFLIHDVSRLRRIVVDRALKPLGITRSQWWVLAFLSRRDGMTQTALAADLDLTKVAIGGLLDRMEAAGFVERRADQSDGRARRVYLTRAGAKMIAAIRESVEAVELEILERIPEDALAQAADTLRTLKDTLLEMVGGDAEEAESAEVNMLG